ncbi:hypothetical protein FA09DRAFT_359877 [Tilletiopsis washingtonensis]|uniref:Uncharacterized protein n=1 Tax=Tilletiopsis washingtonensis TaxID=58919 RepID=A0A316ZEG0_9BASI|nr:hypothetical protein FA09DRAFT_359877 [Tilletiopsis washingtonensis]PWN98695.1 hypothetical protein FA09DRAFT_359877 [Tilletiopsis washingtonensis]
MRMRHAPHGFTETASAARGLEKEKEAGAHDAAPAAPEPGTPGLASYQGAAFGFELADLKLSVKQFDERHGRMLFSSPRMTLNTCLICPCCGVIGIAYALPNSFIALYVGTIGDEDSSQATGQLVIIAACGVPGSLIASVAVELPYLGRRFSMAFFTHADRPLPLSLHHGEHVERRAGLEL